MLEEGEEEEERGGGGAGSSGGAEAPRRRLTSQDSPRNADNTGEGRARETSGQPPQPAQPVQPAQPMQPEARPIQEAPEDHVNIERPNYTGNEPSVPVDAARSSSSFHLDLSPNLNRPDHIYERLEEPSTSTASSTAPTHWRFKMFKSGSKNSKQHNSRDGSLKTGKQSSVSADYDIPKPLGKMADKCFPGKAKNKMKISPIVNGNMESPNINGGSPISLNVCFGKKLLRSPSNSQTLEFNDRSRENRDVAAANPGTATCPRSAPAPAQAGGGHCVYGRLGNTYGRLAVLGSGIGRIERHLSSSCGNIDHYCALHSRAPAAEGNPHFRIENQAVEADRIYQNADNVLEEINRVVAGPSAPVPPPSGIKGISKGSLQWLMVNRWLPLWVANNGGKKEYKVIDLDFSIYDDVQYPACTAACNDEYCYGRNVFETCSLYRRNNCLPVGNMSLNRNRGQRQHEEDGAYNFHVHEVARDNANCPGHSFQVRQEKNEPAFSEELNANADCESPEPENVTVACYSGNRSNYFSAQDSIGENDLDLSIGDNEQSVSECTAGDPASNSSESCSPCSSAAEGLPPSPGSSPSDSSQAPPVDPQPSTSAN